VSGAFITTGNPRLAAIAALAQDLLAVMMETGDEASLNWEEACFAAALAMKARAEMAANLQDQQPAAALAQLREVIELALRQEVKARRFANLEEAEAWAASEGARLEPVPRAKGSLN
jgi:hypothetical protein